MNTALLNIKGPPDLPPPTQFRSLPDLFKHDESFLARISTFANSLSLSLKWNLNHDRDLSIAECEIGDMKACGINKTQRMAKNLAAKNMMRIIEQDPDMKARFLHHVYGPYCPIFLT